MMEMKSCYNLGEKEDRKQREREEELNLCSFFLSFYFWGDENKREEEET